MINEEDTYKETKLELLEFKKVMRFPEITLLANKDVFLKFIESEGRNHLFELSARIYGQKEIIHDTVLVPDGRIANLKLAFFSKWLLKKFPPRMKKMPVQTTQYRCYPEIPVLEPYIKIYEKENL